jgi:hypothetical protein
MSRPPAPPYSAPVKLADIVRAPFHCLAPDEAARSRIAKALGLAALPALDGEFRLTPWHDGVEVKGRWTATVGYTCGVSLDRFDEDLAGEFTVRAVPEGSVLAVGADGGESEVELDLEAEDPPDVLQDETLDVGALLVEHLALELDPFPRKPGAVFEPPPPEEPPSPFAALKGLKKE